MRNWQEFWPSTRKVFGTGKEQCHGKSKNPLALNSAICLWLCCVSTWGSAFGKSGWGCAPCAAGQTLWSGVCCPSAAPACTPWAADLAKVLVWCTPSAGWPELREPQGGRCCVNGVFRHKVLGYIFFHQSLSVVTGQGMTEGRIRLEIRNKFFPVGGVRHWQIAQRSCGCPASGAVSPKTVLCAEEMPFQLLTIIESYKIFHFILPISYLEMLGLESMLLPTDVTVTVPSAVCLEHPCLCLAVWGWASKCCRQMACVPGPLQVQHRVSYMCTFWAKPFFPLWEYSSYYSSYVGECLGCVCSALAVQKSCDLSAWHSSVTSQYTWNNWGID